MLKQSPSDECQSSVDCGLQHGISRGTAEEIIITAVAAAAAAAAVRVKLVEATLINFNDACRECSSRSPRETRSQSSYQ